jgi:hypothetical protein
MSLDQRRRLFFKYEKRIRELSPPEKASACTRAGLQQQQQQQAAAARTGLPGAELAACDCTRFLLPLLLHAFNIDAAIPAPLVPPSPLTTFPSPSSAGV